MDVENAHQPVVHLTKKRGKIYTYKSNYCFKMDPFYSYVSIGAAIILVLILVAFGVMMAELHSTDLFPPTYQKCPDMWAVNNATGQCVVPSSSTAKNLGLLSTNTSTSGSNAFVTTTSGDGSLPDLLDTTNSRVTNGVTQAILKLNDSTTISAKYPAISDRCSKKQWALNNGVVWDGVTNYNAC